jgi:hypothetical protein
LSLEYREACGVEEALLALAEVATVQRCSEKGERVVRVELTGTLTGGIREAVLALFAGKRWELLELRSLPVRLEDIFREVTGGGSE